MIALVGIFVFINTHPVRPHDFWWHITVGREILTTGHIPSFDIYSYTANGQPYPSYQMFWLMEILLYSLYKWGGLELVILVHSLMITSAYLIIFWISRQVSNSWRIAAFGVLFAAALGFNDWNVRPQGITFLLASLFLLAIFQYQKTNKLRWLSVLPIGMMVWVNCHGTFVIGLSVVGIWFGAELWNLVKSRLKVENKITANQLIIPGCALVITILACLVNPRGLGIINYLQTLSGNPAVQNLVTEWAPPSFHTMMGVIFFIGLACSAVILVISPKRPDIFQIGIFVIFTVLSLRTSRGIVWFGLMMATILAEHLAFIVQKYQRASKLAPGSIGNSMLNYLILIVIILAGVFTLPWFKKALPLPPTKASLVSTETPVLATEELLATRPPRQLFHAISFGSYLIWKGYPEYQVFVDSRIELYTEQVWVDYLNISNASEGWESLLDGYGVNTLMLSPYEQPRLVQAILTSGEWVEIYRDETAYLYSRK